MSSMTDPDERTPPPSDAPDEQEGGTEDAPTPAPEMPTQQVRVGGRQGVRVTHAGPTTVRRAGGGTPDDPPPSE